jgi:dienelactone hydrolase
MLQVTRLFMCVSCLMGFCLPGHAKENFLPERDTPVAADQPVPIVDFARPLLFEEPLLNPSGTHFAALTKNVHLETALLVGEISTGKIEWSRPGITNFSWIDDRHLAINSSERLGILTAVEVGNLGKRLDGFALLPRNQRGLMSDTGFEWSWRPDALPKAREIQTEEFWSMPQNGELAYSIQWRNVGHRALYRLEKKEWIECPVDLDKITPIAIGALPGEMIVLGPGEKDAPRPIQRMDVITGKLAEIIYQDPQYDCLPWVSFKRGTREIEGVSAPNSALRVVWLSEHMKQVQNLLNKQFPDKLAYIVSTDLKESRFLIKVESDRQPPTYYFLDQEKKSLGLIKQVGPWIDPGRMRPMQVMTYKTRDGVILEGYLVLPPGASKQRPAPLIIDVHAGPWSSRALWGWRAFAQFFAGRGFAVFQPNYRGSPGYGARASEADRYDFGKMSNDVTDSVHALVQTGLVDGQRVAVQGTGFGAYLALTSAMEEPSLYRAAIVYGGIYDWETAVKAGGQYFSQLKTKFQTYGLIHPSPLRDANKIRTPTFFTRNVAIKDLTRDDQAGAMYAALKKANVPCVNFGDLNIFTENEAHSEICERLAKIEEFLRVHMDSSATTGLLK